MYLYSAGCIEYGLNFIELYRDLLGDLYSRYYEMFISYRRFIDAHYTCACNRISYKLTESNYKLSEKTVDLSDRSYRLSGFVSILTSVSIGISALALLREVLDLPTGYVIFAVLALIGTCYFALHKLFKSKDAGDSDEDGSCGVGNSSKDYRIVHYDESYL